MIDPPENTSQTETGHPMAGVISLLLIVGVGLSAAVLVAGLALLAATGQTGYHDSLSPEMLLASPGTVAFPHTTGDVLQGVVELKPFAVIELGVLLLIATPVFRVAASVLLFALERDRLYVAITLLVLVLLLFSIFWVG